jgi:hypothetical protein
MVKTSITSLLAGCMLTSQHLSEVGAVEFRLQGGRYVGPWRRCGAAYPESAAGGSKCYIEIPRWVCRKSPYVRTPPPRPFTTGH